MGHKLKSTKKKVIFLPIFLLIFKYLRLFFGDICIKIKFYIFFTFLYIFDCFWHYDITEICILYSYKTSPTERSVAKFSNPTRLPNCKNKDLIVIPWMLAFALQNLGWCLRHDIIWNKPNPMPESVRDRCTKAHEYLFLFSKSAKYYFDHSDMLEPAKYEETKSNVQRQSKIPK